MKQPLQRVGMQISQMKCLEFSQNRIPYYMRLLTLIFVSIAGISSAGNNNVGDSARGEKIVKDMRKASCLICHKISSFVNEKDMGEIGPDLSNIGDRLSKNDLMLRIIDARLLNPDTIMPPYFSLSNLNAVGQQYVDKTIYTEQELNDVVEFLSGLREQK
jgi:sulfur-oxidizing protein SoxX